MLSDYFFWVSVSRVFSIIGFFATILFGLILILLNTFVVKRVNTIYKCFMNVFTCQGMFFATLEIAFLPNLLSYNAGYMFFLLEVPLAIDKSLLQVLLAIYSGILCSTMTMLAVQFLYRYWTVSDTNKLKYFRGWKISIWFLYSLFFGLIWGGGLCIVEFPTEETMSYFREEISARYNRSIQDLPALIMMPYHPKDGSIRWKAWILTLVQALISSIQYGIMVYCGWSMQTKMEQTIRTMSRQTKLLHQQFFKVLIIQITAPTILLLVPLSFIIYLPFFDLEVSIPTGALLCSFTIYNAIDSIIVMTVVSEYRKSAKKLLASSLQKFHSWLTTNDAEPAQNTTTLALQQIPAL